MMLPTGTMANQIQHMKAGLAQRIIAPVDARRTTVMLTIVEIERIYRGIDTHASHLKGLLARITDEELEFLDSLLRRREDSVENAGV